MSHKVGGLVRETRKAEYLKVGKLEDLVRSHILRLEFSKGWNFQIAGSFTRLESLARLEVCKSHKTGRFTRLEDLTKLENFAKL